MFMLLSNGFDIEDGNGNGDGEDNDGGGDIPRIIWINNTMLYSISMYAVRSGLMVVMASVIDARIPSSLVAVAAGCGGHPSVC